MSTTFFTDNCPKEPPPPVPQQQAQQQTPFAPPTIPTLGRCVIPDDDAYFLTPLFPPPPIPLKDDAADLETPAVAAGADKMTPFCGPTFPAQADASSLAYVRDRFMSAFSLMGIVDSTFPSAMALSLSSSETKIRTEGNEELLSMLSREFNMLVDYYSESQRHYHTLQHVEDCLRKFDMYAAAWCDNSDSNSISGVQDQEQQPMAAVGRVSTSAAIDRAIILMAIFYHDSIYDPKSPVNEGKDVM